MLPDANVPTSSNGIPVGHGSSSDLGPVLDTWLAQHAEGTACVVGEPTFRATSRVQSLSPEPGDASSSWPTGQVDQHALAASRSDS